MIDALDEDPVTEEARIEVLRNFIRQLVYIKQPGEVIDESLLAGGTPKDLKGRIIKSSPPISGRTGKTRGGRGPGTRDGRIVLSRQEYTALEVPDGPRQD